MSAAAPPPASPEVEIINKIVKIGEIATQPITDKWFYWAMLTFILHHRDWKYANFDIAMLMWIVHSLSAIYSKLMNYLNNGMNSKLSSEQKWKTIESPSFLLSYLSEVIGDWYVVFILKQIVSRRKYGLAALCCLASSIVKILIGIKLVSGYDSCDKIPQGKSCFTESQFWKEYQYLECVNVLTTFIYYGVCLFILLRTKDEYESQKRLNPSSYTLVKRFRRDSKYRMILSCIFALVSCVFGLPFVYDTLVSRKFEFRLEVTREAVMSLTYYMIYIDQILKSEQKGGQAFRSTSNGNSTSNYSSGNHTHNTQKIGFSSKGALDSSKIHDMNDYGATPWNNNSGNYNINNNYNNYSSNNNNFSNYSNY
ncbi:hypothetical protein BCR32DRAFT_273493 [Anaeromyces robustus]|jgi:hypothetical protein|uniref:Uncharacterized protein n=1 Tax=Anaeromyces robustus TaxID=1754192 RepID=A0A1Y1VQC7_9FUNG|nr:hypothetical protein BCR32DRAFT_273493 [Anaeromyces robustus]|eukprot:ORX63255.1 hypothetical protein BCR32DRAFT_273493 [Anaeromyces robustus]